MKRCICHWSVSQTASRCWGASLIGHWSLLHGDPSICMFHGDSQEKARLLTRFVFSSAIRYQCVMFIKRRDGVTEIHQGMHYTHFTASRPPGIQNMTVKRVQIKHRQESLPLNLFPTRSKLSNYVSHRHKVGSEAEDVFLVCEKLRAAFEGGSRCDLLFSRGLAVLQEMPGCLWAVYSKLSVLNHHFWASCLFCLTGKYTEYDTEPCSIKDFDRRNSRHLLFRKFFSIAPGSPSSGALCTTSSFDKLRFSAALLSCDVARCVFMKFICKRHNGGLEGPRVQTPQLGLCHTNDRRHGNAINLDRLIEKHCWENTMTWHAFLDINLLNLWNLFATSLKALCPWECSAFAVAVQESVNCKPSIWIIAFLWEQSINMTL